MATNNCNVSNNQTNPLLFNMFEWIPIKLYHKHLQLNCKTTIAARNNAQTILVTSVLVRIISVHVTFNHWMNYWMGKKVCLLKYHKTSALLLKMHCCRNWRPSKYWRQHFDENDVSRYYCIGKWFDNICSFPKST